MMKHWFVLGSLLLSAAATAEIELASPPKLPPTEKMGVCSFCVGEKMVPYEKVSKFTEDLSRKSRITVKCPQCLGKGECVTKLSPQERLDAHAQTIARFESEQAKLGRVPVGGCFAEREAYEALPLMKQIELARNHPKACETCAGLAYQVCRKCKGEGKIIKRRPRKETNASAHALGSTQESRIREYRRKEILRENLEPEEEVLPCKECTSEGTIPCRRCKGVGLKPVCRRCEGAGYTERRRVREGMESNERCRSCKGTGRK